MSKCNIALFVGVPPACKCGEDAKVQVTLTDGRIVNLCAPCLIALVEKNL
jgi:hypothetical protein